MRLSFFLTLGLTVLAASSPTAAQTVVQTPFKAGNNYFFIASDGALYVRHSLQGNARQLLQSRAYGTLTPSWDGKYVAYGYGTSADNRGFFYTRVDTVEHRERVYYHRVGESQAHDEIIYSRQDSVFETNVVAH
jgi:hypothetical protein